MISLLATFLFGKELMRFFFFVFFTNFICFQCLYSCSITRMLNALYAYEVQHEKLETSFYRQSWNYKFSFLSELYSHFPPLLFFQQALLKLKQILKLSIDSHLENLLRSSLLQMPNLWNVFIYVVRKFRTKPIMIKS